MPSLDLGAPVAFCGAPYVDMFAAGYETMAVGLPYDGPEAQAAVPALQDAACDSDPVMRQAAAAALKQIAGARP